jgi:ABC-2 type transport system permease protein
LSGVAILFLHSLKRIRTLLLAMGLLLAAFQILLIAVARSIFRSGGFRQLSALLPPFARQMMGPSFVSVMSFSGIVCVGYFHVAVMSALIGLAIAVSTQPASEIETGFADLILSRPVPRRAVITRTILLLLVCTAVTLGLMLSGTYGGLAALAPEGADVPEAKLLRSLVTGLGLLMLCWGGIALALASMARRRSTAGGIAGLLALATFLLDYAGRMWEPADRFARLSPFRYFNPFALVMGDPLPARSVYVLAGIAVAGFALAYVAYSRRDISH